MTCSLPFGHDLPLLHTAQAARWENYKQDGYSLTSEELNAKDKEESCSSGSRLSGRSGANDPMAEQKKVRHEHHQITKWQPLSLPGGFIHQYGNGHL